MSKKTQILTLIESEIKAIRLMNLLENQQIDFDLYLTDHSTLIFEHIGIDTKYHTDELYTTYFSLISKGKTIDLENEIEALKQLILHVYTYLLKYSELCAVFKEGKTQFATTVG